jgi:ferritin-like metal-binding protein YciE
MPGGCIQNNLNDQEVIMTVKTLEDLFQETLKDLYYTENKLVKTLPKMAKQAASPTLKEAIEHHLEETEGHITRLEEVFGIAGSTPASRRCEAVEGLVKETEEILAEIEDLPTIDAAIISSAQTVEHYEIARYGTLVCWARQLGLKDAEFLLQKTLDEEQAADKKLSRLAEEYVNQKAAA